MSNAKLFVISGPSAVGKGTIVEKITKADDSLYLSVSATSRKPRPGETEGVSYFYLTEEEFKDKIKQNGFLEYASVHGHLYGTPKEPVERELAKGRNVILEIDVQGGLKVKETFPEGIFIFIIPPSFEELRNRIYKRGTESEADIAVRLGKAEEEMGYLSHYDYYVVNDDLGRAVQDVAAIIRANGCRVDNAQEIIKNVKGEF